MNVRELKWWNRAPLVVFLFSVSFKGTGCIRRSDDIISEDYDEIDRRNPPVFINNTRTQVVVAEGKDARLDCRVSNVGDRTVSWIRQRDVHIMTMGGVVYTSDPRVAVSHSGDLWTMTIGSTKVTDSSRYECQVNTEPKKSKEFSLRVVVSNARIVGDRDVLVQFGSDINLTCRSKDSPQPPSSVLWYKDGVRVDSLLARGGISVVTESRRRTSRLLVSQVTEADAGNYTCAPAESKTDSVTVHVIKGADPRANVMASAAPTSSSSYSSKFYAFITLLAFVIVGRTGSQHES